MMNEEEIQVLIDKSKKQDMTAFALLVTEYRQLVFRLAFRLLCNEEEARDMVQETFIKVWLNLDKYNREYRFSTWLYKITGNICYDRLRFLQHTLREVCKGHPSTISPYLLMRTWNKVL